MIFLADRYGFNVIILLNVRSFYLAGKKRQRYFPLLGLVLAAGLLLFPISPGPMVIGDLLPAAAVLFCVFNFVLSLSGAEHHVSFAGKKDRFLGHFVLFVAIIHFLFPSIVII